MRASLFRAIAAVSIAFATTFLFGSFAGWTTKPGQVEAFEQALDDLRARDSQISVEDVELLADELKRTHPAFLAPPRHPLAAMLQMYPHVIAIALAISLLALRPRPLHAGLISLVAALGSLATRQSGLAIALALVTITYCLALLLARRLGHSDVVA